MPPGIRALAPDGASVHVPSPPRESRRKPRQTHQPVKRKQKLGKPNRFPLAGAGSERQPREKSQTILLAFAQLHHQAKVTHLLLLIRVSAPHAHRNLARKSLRGAILDNRAFNRRRNRSSQK